MTIVFGNTIQGIITYSPVVPGSRDALDNDVRTGCIYFVILGIGMFAGSYVLMVFWTIAGENQAKRYRESYFKAIVRQDIGWFDSIPTGELTSRMSG